MNEHFSWYRLGLLIRNDIVRGYRSFLTAGISLSIIMLLNALPGAAFGHVRDGFYFGWFTGMLLIWGTIHASLLFTELHDKTRNEGWLLLPASALEKTLARLLNGTVFFILLLLLFTILSSLVIEGINQGLLGRHNPLFNPLAPAVWEVIGLFLIIQPVFFLGGAWFRKHCWVKTVTSGFLIALGLGLLACIVFLILFAGYFSDGGWVLPQEFNLGGTGLNEDAAMMFDAAVIGLKILCYGIMPPFCWYIAWLRVQETQVNYGV